MQLHASCPPETQFKTESDSEIVLHLYKAHGADCFNMLDGIFATAISDGVNTTFARDPLGVKPLYVGVDISGALWFSSEIKGINDKCSVLAPFPPGCYWDSRDGVEGAWQGSDSPVSNEDGVERVRLGALILKCHRYFKPSWWSGETPSGPHDPATLYNALDAAVKKRMMADVPVAVFLSGGLDSSTMAAMAKRHLPETQPELHSFSVGVGSPEQSPDVLAARVAAKALGTVHHEIIFTPEEGFAAIRDVIYYLESYDPSPMRSGVAMYLLCGEVAKFAKVCICGEAADEVFAGYLYFNEAKDTGMLHRETVTKIKNLHGVQLQFQDRLGMAQSLEIRVPFLDKELLGVALNVDPAVKMHTDHEGKSRIEKWYMRDAIEKCGNDLLPKEILWRRKEQFGDGVGCKCSTMVHVHSTCTVHPQRTRATPKPPPPCATICCATIEEKRISVIFARHANTTLVDHRNHCTCSQHGHALQTRGSTA